MTADEIRAIPLEELAIAIRPAFGQAPHLGPLKQVLLELLRAGHDPADLATPIARCYRDPDTTSPHRLTHRGPNCPWWNPPKRPAPPRETLPPKPPPRTPQQRQAAHDQLQAGLRKAAEQRARDATRPVEPTEKPDPSNLPERHPIGRLRRSHTPANPNPAPTGDPRNDHHPPKHACRDHSLEHPPHPQNPRHPRQDLMGGVVSEADSEAFNLPCGTTCGGREAV